MVKIQAWDTAGQERYQAITDAYYQGAKGVLIVFDVTKESSFSNLPKWYGRIQDATEGKIVKLLIGNKIDLENNRAVTTDLAKEYAKKNNMMFIETSALDSTNIEEAF